MKRRSHHIRSLQGSIVLAFVLLLCARCDLVEPVEERQLVVEAFFSSEQPLGPITLRTTQPLASPDNDTTAPAQGAEVTLRLDGTRISYEAADAAPGRYVPDTSMMVPSGAAFSLSVRWEGQHATASGTVPPPIAVEAVSVDVEDEAVEAILVDSLRRDSLDIPAEQGFIYPVEVTVAWTTDFQEVGPDSAYWIRPQLRPYAPMNSSTVVDFFLQPEAVLRERTVSRNEGRRHWTGVYAVPVEHAEAPLPEHQLRVSLVRGDADFAAFATSRGDPERREPISNVRGAIGIATAIAVDSVRVGVGPDAQ